VRRVQAVEWKAELLSREETISRPRREGLAELNPKDLHLHINLSFGSDEIPAPVQGPTEAQLCEVARQIYRARRKRDQVMDCDLFGEPAWDMLLALYCLPNEGERLSVTALSLAADLPQATGHRWQRTLTKRGLIKRVPDGRDGRRQFVSLTTRGRKLLEDYLSVVALPNSPWLQPDRKHLPLSSGVGVEYGAAQEEC
jgi:DNA-binding MarR family transcriptional regulator